MNNLNPALDMSIFDLMRVVAVSSLHSKDFTDGLSSIQMLLGIESDGYCSHFINDSWDGLTLFQRINILTQWIGYEMTVFPEAFSIEVDHVDHEKLNHQHAKCKHSHILFDGVDHEISTCSVCAKYVPKEEINIVSSVKRLTFTTERIIKTNCQPF